MYVKLHIIYMRNIFTYRLFYKCNSECNKSINTLAIEWVKYVYFQVSPEYV